MKKFTPLLIIIFTIGIMPVFAQNFDVLKKLLDATSIPYIADDKKELCAIEVGESKESDSKTIFVRLDGGNNDFVIARITIIDGKKNCDFPPEIYKECLEFNQRTGLLKTQYDTQYGDIDLTYETWLSTSPDDFTRGLRYLADNADVLAKKLKTFIKK
ncbi:hypothetical protein J7L68_08340 [bacterium]|nr:hypothetical protein [bacterium]